MSTSTHIGISHLPLLLLALEVIAFPKGLNELNDIIGSPNLFKTNIRIILHALWLSLIHEHAIEFKAVTVISTTLLILVVMPTTTFNVVQIKTMTITQCLQGLALETQWHGIVLAVWIGINETTCCTGALTSIP
jgi:hypothetical protein